jgi:hypothetical protein
MFTRWTKYPPLARASSQRSGASGSSARDSSRSDASSSATARPPALSQHAQCEFVMVYRAWPSKIGWPQWKHIPVAKARSTRAANSGSRVITANPQSPAHARQRVQRSAERRSAPRNSKPCTSDATRMDPWRRGRRTPRRVVRRPRGNARNAKSAAEASLRWGGAHQPRLAPTSADASMAASMAARSVSKNRCSPER